VGNPVAKIGIHEINTVPTKIATNAGATEAATVRMGFLKTADAK
jgi:hypothetical protein